MNKITKLIIVRHGQSLGNATRTFLGHTDKDMSELGYKQALATAEHLKNEKIDKIYSSDLIRAYNTAVPHAKIRNLDINCRENLREIYVGDWENRTFEEIIEKWGREMYEKEWFGNFGLFRFPDGESIIEGGNRFYDELKSICSENMGKTLLIAAHAAVIRSFWAKISGILPENLANELPFPTNASYSVAYFDGENFTPDEYSIDSHLASVGITKVKM